MSPDEYCAKNPHLSHASRLRLRYSVNRWTRLVGVPLTEAQTEHFTTLRTAGLDLGLSPHSIEQTAADIALLTGLPKGTPLPLPQPSPDVPTIQQVDASTATSTPHDGP